MIRLMKIKPAELPLLVAAFVFVGSMVGWAYDQSSRPAAMATTTMTLNTLQSALNQYVDVTGRAPHTLTGHRSMYEFLVSYQRRFSHRMADGTWVPDTHSAMLFLRPDETRRGWISMPGGSRMRGIVGVMDGFGSPIRYVGPHSDARHGPCFVTTNSNITHWEQAVVYSTNVNSF